MNDFRAAEAALHDAARASTGLDDFGDDGYREGLGVLLDSLDEEARLTEVGDLVLKGMIVEALKGRLRSEEGFERFPEAGASMVEKPVFIVGLPRTGTTALHHLMAQNPALQSLELWLTGAPKPRPARDSWSDDPDFRASDAQTRALYERSPDMKAIHFMSAELPDECWRLLSQDFAHSSWEASATIPSYSRWWASHDMHPAYRRHRKNVQVIGHQEPNRTWLLKDATHLFAMDALLDVYPDARIIQTHRDPTRLIGSVCSLCWSSRRPLNVDEDPKAFGQSTLALWERAILSTLSVRRERPDAKFYDLPFEKFVADPVGVVAEIHDHFDLAYAAEAEARVERFFEENPPGKHGGHAYRLEDWGLESAEILDRFRAYVRAFDIPVSEEA